MSVLSLRYLFVSMRIVALLLRGAIGPGHGERARRPSLGSSNLSRGGIIGDTRNRSHPGEVKSGLSLDGVIDDGSRHEREADEDHDSSGTGCRDDAGCAGVR